MTTTPADATPAAETPAATADDDTQAEALLADAVSADAKAGDEDPPGAEQLGDPGKKALDTMKAERNAARKEAAAAKAEADRLKAQAEGREAEHKAELEKQRIKDEALSAANDRILKAEIRAAAAAKLTDPADALQFIDRSEFEVNEDGGVDTNAIAKAIDDLIESKPYLAAQGGGKFQGSADGGARKDALKPAQLTEAEVKQLYAEGRNEEIVKAKAEGRLAEYLAS